MVKRETLCMLVYQTGLRSKFNFEKLVKRETLSCGFAMVWLKGGINTSEKWWNLACMFLYQTGFPIYDQISTSRIWSKVNLHHSISLRFGLKEVRIALNILKVGMHSYLPNGHLNIWSNFNYEKLVKCETSSCGFAKVGFKGVEIKLEHF